MGRKALDLISKKYGRLTVIERVGSNKYSKPMYRCLCDCGKESIVMGNLLPNGYVKSCGCLREDNRRLSRYSHGQTGSDTTPEYRAWHSMKYRCSSPTAQNYENYGGRGIKVCDSWVESFDNFFNDMGRRPSDLHSIDRIDNDGDYCPENCRWATKAEQSMNIRTNKWVIYEGQKMILAELGRKLGMHPNKAVRYAANGKIPGVVFIDPPKTIARRSKEMPPGLSLSEQLQWKIDRLPK